MNEVLCLFLLTGVVSIVSSNRLAASDWTNIHFRQTIPSSASFPSLPLNNGQGRIVGGIEAIPYSLPYQAIILVGNTQTLYYCGGSLISNNYVLTSASSLYEAEFAEVMLAAHNFSETSEHQVNIMAIEFIVHEKWDPLTLSDDIGLIKLSKSVTFNEYIQPVKLPRYSDVSNSYEGDVARVSGWGKKKNEDDFLSPALRYVDVPVMNLFDCGMIYFGFVIDSNICTVGDGGKGFCIGDAGGPLVLDNVQIGVISFTYWNACESGYPSVYTRVTSYLDWISTNTDVLIDP